jgi:hypothetical protein
VVLINLVQTRLIRWTLTLIVVRPLQPPKENSSKQSDALSIALMTQRLSGNDLSSEKTFEEWIVHFELKAEMHKWNSQAGLIHLIT